MYQTNYNNLNNTLGYRPYKISKLKIKDIKGNSGIFIDAMRTHEIFNSLHLRKPSPKYRTSNILTLHFGKNEEIWFHI